MELRPHLLVGLPHGCAKTLARVLERHHKQQRPFVRGGFAGDEGQRPLPVIDLRFFARQKLQDIEALRRARAEFRDKAFHRVVLVREAVRIDELLVDAHRVAAKLDLRLDPRAVRFARRRRDRRRGVGHSRWPGWGSLPRGGLGAGGHPGGVCGQRAVVPADGFVRHPRAPGDLMLAGAAREERFDGRTEMRLQDVHSFLARC